jgi:hypothetical protein
MVLEGELVVFGHLYPDCCLADSSALWQMGFQQLSARVSVQAALTEVFLFSMLALIKEEAVEISDPSVVEPPFLLD